MALQASVEVVGIFDEQFKRLFNKTHPMKATVSEEAQLFSHPLEDKTELSDHRVISPIEITIVLQLDPGDYRSAYGELRTSFRRALKYTIKTRTDTYTNMVMQSIPHEEDAATPDLVTLIATFKEAIFVSAQFQALPPRSVKRPNDASTVKRGEQAGSGSSGQGSTLYRMIN